MSRGRRDRGKPWLLLGGVALFLLTKGKTALSLLKFGKFGGVLISMFVSIGAYALLFPVAFAVGLVLMLLIHEMGHVWAAKRKGLPVSAPLFIPFLGALIMMKRHPRDAVTEAYIAMGGPLLGTIGAAACMLLGMALQNPLLLVIAKVGFFLNLFNLLPIHPLDGGRIATAVTRWLWIAGLAGGLAVIYWMPHPLIMVIWLLFAWELFRKYVLNRGRGRRTVLRVKMEADVAGLPEWMIPGEDHRRALPFETWSDLEGNQTVVLHWPGLGLRHPVSLAQQFLVVDAKVVRLEHAPPGPEGPEKLQIQAVLELEYYLNDKYYDVPAALRLKFGAAYGLLALFLVGMLAATAALTMPPGI